MHSENKCEISYKNELTAVRTTSGNNAEQTTTMTGNTLPLACSTPERKDKERNLILSPIRRPLSYNSIKGRRPIDSYIVRMARLKPSNGTYVVPKKDRLEAAMNCDIDDDKNTVQTQEYGTQTVDDAEISRKPAQTDANTSTSDDDVTPYLGIVSTPVSMPQKVDSTTQTEIETKTEIIPEQPEKTHDIYVESDLTLTPFDSDVLSFSQKSMCILT